MKKTIALAFALALSGCASSAPSNDLRRGFAVAAATYADVFQPAVIAYGNLPACPAAVLCRNPATHAKLKAVDLAAVRTIEAARASARAADFDAAKVSAAIVAIAEAESAIANAGALISK